MIRDEVYEFIAQSIIARKHDYYRIALSFCGNRDDSMDAIAEMTVIAIEKYDSLKNKNAFTGWSTQILINICRKQLRQQKRTVYIDDLEFEIVDPRSMDALSVDMQAALASIKPIYREVILLKAALHFTSKEIAALLRLPLGTVQSRYDYGVKQLRNKLGGNYNEEI